MLKKKCLAALSGILLAITVIAPFSFKEVHASIGYDFFRVVSTIDVGSGIGSQLDFYFVPSNYASGTISITVNPVFAITSDAYAYSLEEGNGVRIKSVATQNSGSAVKYTFEFELTNCSGFHFFVQHQDANFWTTQKISQYWLYWGSFSPTTTMSLTYGLPITDSSYHLLYIQSKLQYIASDIENIETYSGQIVNKLDDLIALFEAQTGSSAADAIENNDNQNETASDVISDYDTLTSTFDSNFNSSQEDMETIMQNTSLTAFTDATVWFTTQLGLLYQSLGNMQILVAMPLILGIALFFIGRGNVIFKSPDTTTWSTTTRIDEYNENGIHQYKTLTKTTRSRGKK